ncbi:unnamed protein product [Cylindrotheca closterium]|uniref:Uncharacterized protein n=1 Tax=Cylindrotheca closterium TaxID=2856 RepID=A0AAD2JPS6_9STRA|nr:unnamed protein product [Cylindrotheca closterium]
MPFSRPAMNHVCDRTSGLIVSMDFGAYGDLGDRPVSGGHIERMNHSTRCPAAAIFNGPAKVDFVAVTNSEVFTGVKSGRIDVAAGRTRTLEREIKHSSSGGFAFDFSPPYFYDGMIVAGYEPHGRCAANLFFDETCADTLICVPELTTWLDAVAAMSSLQDYFVGTEQHTKEPLSLMHRSDDQQFSDLIRWIIYGLFNAEEKGIAKDTSIEMPTTNLFGSELTGIWQNSVRESGNYGEMFSRNLDGLVVRDGLNLLNRLDGPQLCASPGTAPSFK